MVVPLVLRRIEREEEMLLAELGEAYRVYQSKTRRLIPQLY
jgi:protein-S-isoprenylcysteine O-methyltransferase Ste14